MEYGLTNQFSFVLKPSDHGVGVFITHGVAAGTKLRLWSGEAQRWELTEVPAHFQTYCVRRRDHLWGPRDFGSMDIGWYLNHSTNPNADYRADDEYYANRDICAGEEIVIDYNALNEPMELREDYYRQPANSGHGHVRPRPDGVKARCGGPALCRECAKEQAALVASHPSHA